MQALRNITRSFLFRKAVTKLKSRSNALNVTQVYILYCFYVAGGKDRFISIPEVAVIMEDCNRAQKHSKIYKDCQTMASGDYLSRSESDLIRYRLSVVGLNLLMQVEKTARAERWDR